LRKLFEKTKPICVSPQHCWGLKKQSQFAAEKIGVNSYMKGHYENKPPIRAQKNKANQRQFKFYRRERRARRVKKI
jgi:hypothetical protein